MHTGGQSYDNYDAIKHHNGRNKFECRKGKEYYYKVLKTDRTLVYILVLDVWPESCQGL